MKIFKIAFQSHPRWLQLVRGFITEACGLADFSKSDTHHIVLAVDEACTNILKHSYKGKTDKTIVLECERRRGYVQFVLKDSGHPVDCCKIEHRKLEEVRPGGLGVFFITKMMDDVKYARKKGINILTMRKNVQE